MKSTHPVYGTLTERGRLTRSLFGLKSDWRRDYTAQAYVRPVGYPFYAKWLGRWHPSHGSTFLRAAERPS